MKSLFNYLTILFILLLLPTSALAPPIRSGGPITYGGGGVATDIATDTTNFDGALTVADTTVQAALDTLDDAAAAAGVVEDDIYGPGWNGDTTHTASQNAIYDFLHLLDTDDDGDIDSIDAAVLATSVSAYTVREISKHNMTNGDTQTALSEANMLAHKYVSNQGETVELDIILVAVSYPIQIIFSIEEPLVMEICPPAGEILDLDGVNLDADDCVDSDSTVGSKIVALRMQIADASWRWSLDTIRGAWVDTGVTD